jgi:hypothetical protein
MSANFSNLPPETQELLAQRYGIRRKSRWKIPAAILFILGRVTLVSFQNEKSDSIDITYLIERRNPSLPLTCTLVARDIDKNVVGEIEDKVPASTTSRITISRTIPARIAPVNAAVLDCRAAQS